MLLLCALLVGEARPQDAGHRAGLLLGTASIAPGLMPQQGQRTSYVVGMLAYHPEERISFMGRGAWYIGAEGDDGPLLQDHHQLTAGPRYHWGTSQLDLHTGPEAGISITRLTATNVDDAPKPLRVLPVIAWNAGLTFYVWDHFHFFLDLRYQHARYEGAAQGAIPLGELTLAGGLGFHLRTTR